MRRFKDLEACIASLKAVQAQGDIGPEQKREIEAAIAEARRLRRKQHADSCDAFACVRKVTECLLNAFMK